MALGRTADVSAATGSSELHDSLDALLSDVRGGDTLEASIHRVALAVKDYDPSRIDEPTQAQLSEALSAVSDAILRASASSDTIICSASKLWCEIARFCICDAALEATKRHGVAEALLTVPFAQTATILAETAEKQLSLGWKDQDSPFIFDGPEWLRHPQAQAVATIGAIWSLCPMALLPVACSEGDAAPAALWSVLTSSLKRPESAVAAIWTSTLAVSGSMPEIGLTDMFCLPSGHFDVPEGTALTASNALDSARSEWLSSPSSQVAIRTACLTASAQADESLPVRTASAALAVLDDIPSRSPDEPAHTMPLLPPSPSSKPPPPPGSVTRHISAPLPVKPLINAPVPPGLASRPMPASSLEPQSSACSSARLSRTDGLPSAASPSLQRALSRLRRTVDGATATASITGPAGSDSGILPPTLPAPFNANGDGALPGSVGPREDADSHSNTDIMRGVIFSPFKPGGRGGGARRGGSDSESHHVSAVSGRRNSVDGSSNLQHHNHRHDDQPLCTDGSDQWVEAIAVANASEAHHREMAAQAGRREAEANAAAVEAAKREAEANAAAVEAAKREAEANAAAAAARAEAIQAETAMAELQIQAREAKAKHLKATAQAEAAAAAAERAAEEAARMATERCNVAQAKSAEAEAEAEAVEANLQAELARAEAAYSLVKAEVIAAKERVPNLQRVLDALVAECGKIETGIAAAETRRENLEERFRAVDAAAATASRVAEAGERRDDALETLRQAEKAAEAAEEAAGIALQRQQRARAALLAASGSTDPSHPTVARDGLHDETMTSSSSAVMLAAAANALSGELEGIMWQRTKAKSQPPDIGGMSVAVKWVPRCLRLCCGDGGDGVWQLQVWRVASASRSKHQTGDDITSTMVTSGTMPKLVIPVNCITAVGIRQTDDSSSSMGELVVTMEQATESGLPHDADSHKPPLTVTRRSTVFRSAPESLTGGKQAEMTAWAAALSSRVPGSAATLGGSAAGDEDGSSAVTAITARALVDSQEQCHIALERATIAEKETIAAVSRVQLLQAAAAASDAELKRAREELQRFQVSTSASLSPRRRSEPMLQQAVVPETAASPDARPDSDTDAKPVAVASVAIIEKHEPAERSIRRIARRGSGASQRLDKPQGVSFKQKRLGTDKPSGKAVQRRPGPFRVAKARAVRVPTMKTLRGRADHALGGTPAGDVTTRHQSHTRQFRIGNDVMNHAASSSSIRNGEALIDDRRRDDDDDDDDDTAGDDTADDGVRRAFHDEAMSVQLHEALLQAEARADVARASTSAARKVIAGLKAKSVAANQACQAAQDKATRLEVLHAKDRKRMDRLERRINALQKSNKTGITTATISSSTVSGKSDQTIVKSQVHEGEASKAIDTAAVVVAEEMEQDGCAGFNDTAAEYAERDDATSHTRTDTEDADHTEDEDADSKEPESDGQGVSMEDRVGLVTESAPVTPVPGVLAESPDALPQLATLHNAPLNSDHTESRSTAADVQIQLMRQHRLILQQTELLGEGRASLTAVAKDVARWGRTSSSAGRRAAAIVAQVTNVCQEWQTCTVADRALTEDAVAVAEAFGRVARVAVAAAGVGSGLHEAMASAESHLAGVQDGIATHTQTSIESAAKALALLVDCATELSCVEGAGAATVSAAETAADIAHRQRVPSSLSSSTVVDETPDLDVSTIKEPHQPLTLVEPTSQSVPGSFTASSSPAGLESEFAALQAALMPELHPPPRKQTMTPSPPESSSLPASGIASLSHSAPHSAHRQDSAPPSSSSPSPAGTAAAHASPHAQPSAAVESSSPVLDSTEHMLAMLASDVHTCSEVLFRRLCAALHVALTDTRPRRADGCLIASPNHKMSGRAARPLTVTRVKTVLQACGLIQALRGSSSSTSGAAVAGVPPPPLTRGVSAVRWEGACTSVLGGRHRGGRGLTAQQLETAIYVAAELRFGEASSAALQRSGVGISRHDQAGTTQSISHASVELVPGVSVRDAVTRGATLADIALGCGGAAWAAAALHMNAAITKAVGEEECENVMRSVAASCGAEAAALLDLAALMGQS